MASFKRMVVISEQEYQQKCLPPTGTTTTDTLPVAAALPPDQAVACLERPPLYVSSRQTADEVKIEKEKATKDKIKELLETSPNYLYKSRALALYQWLKQQKPQITWTGDSGEVTLFKQLLSGSSIIDLIYRAVDSVKRKLPPPGWREFLYFLKTARVPQSLVHPKTVALANLPLERKETAPPPPPPPTTSEAGIALLEKKRRKRQAPTSLRVTRSPIKLRRRLEALPKEFR